MAHPAKELVLGRVERDEPFVLGLDPGEQLGVAKGNTGEAGEEVEQVLVCPIPGGGGGSPADEDAQDLGAGPDLRADGEGIAGHPLFLRGLGRVAGHEARVDQVEGSTRVRARARDQRLDPGPRIPGRHGGDDPPDLAVAARNPGGETILALGEAGQLVVGREVELGGGLAGSHPVERGGERPDRRGQAARQGGGEQDDDERRDGDRDEEQGQQVGVGQPVAEDEHDPGEDGQRGDGGHQQGDRQADPEGEGRSHRASPSSR
ncbi:MAG: hypothetical protein H6Q36_1958 [Chloroflexi bacterium]|nr:hypothetical protein [Chloroflexota bacterium]